MSWFDKIGESLKRFSEHVKTGAENIRENIHGGFEDARDLGERSAFNLKEGHIGTAIGEKVLHDAAVLGNIASLGAAHGIGQKLADSGKLDSVFEKASTELPQGRERKITGYSQGIHRRGEALGMDGVGPIIKAARKDTPIATSVAAGVAGVTALSGAAANLADVNKTTVGLGGVAGSVAGAAFAAAQNLDTTVKASQDKDTGKAARGSEFDYIQKSADGVSVELGGK